MRTSLSILALLVSAPAALGQTAMVRAHQGRERATSASPATLVLLEAKGSHDLQAGFTTLLQSAELSAYAVPIRTYVLGSGAEKDLLERLRLAPKAQWLLLGSRDAILAAGEVVPDAARWSRELQGAGFRDLAKALRDYLREFPDSLEARERLIAVLRARAEATAQRLLGIQVARESDRLAKGDLGAWLKAQQDPTVADLSGAKVLTPAQDLEAWAAFAQELDVAFRGGRWREMDLSFTREGRPLDATSPTLKGIYQRWQPEVEAALRQQPESETLWPLWLWMNAATGGTRLGALLAGLEPTPLTPRDQWPPEAATRALLRAARTLEDWRSVKTLYLARWEAAPHALGGRATAGPAADTALLEQDWAATLEPLLESSLRAGDPGLANTLLLEALAACRWRALPAKAATLARRCGQPDLAARWAALPVR